MRIILPLLVASFVPLTAADLTVRDIRIELGRGDVGSYDAEYRYTAGAGSLVPSGTYKADEYDGDAPFFASVLWTKADLSPWGFLWAFGVEYQGSSEEVDGEDFATTAIGGKARLGVGWTPAPLWRLEATVEGHLGYLVAEDADITANGDLDRADADGSYTALGVQVGGGYAIKGKWEVGVSLRALAYSAQTEAEFYATGGSYEADIDWIFWSAALTGAYRF